jgi:hypothetical protein
MFDRAGFGCKSDNDAGAWPTVVLVTVGNIAAIYALRTLFTE